MTKWLYIQCESVCTKEQQRGYLSGSANMHADYTTQYSVLKIFENLRKLMFPFLNVLSILASGKLLLNLLLASQIVAKCIQETFANK